MAKKGIIVLDPGHGGTTKIGGSSANNATSVSGIPEKQITLEIAQLVRESVQKRAAEGGHDVKIVMTRETDTNLSLSDRAKVAGANNADLLLSIHCNASDAHNARGVETLVMPTAKGNTNLPDDRKFAQRIQDAVLLTIKKHDPATKDRKVKEQELGVLNDAFLAKHTRSCLVELEFIDVKAVDDLLNVGPDAPQVRQDLADALADALIESL